MDSFDKLETWAAGKRSRWFTFLRVTLGVFIIVKGIQFTADMESLQTLSGGMDIFFASAGIAHYVVGAHLIGGALLALGLYTRWMCLAQLPVLLGAVFFVNIPRGFQSFTSSIELEVSILVLAGLVFFMVLGAGQYSIDELRRRDNARLRDLKH